MITTILIIISVYIGCTYVFRSYRDFGLVNSRWYTPFPNMSFSAMEFYKSIEDALEKKEIADMKISRVTYSQGGIFSSNRDYLRIARGEYIFLICAAPFGTDFFVSWWGGQQVTFFMDLIPRIPLIGPLLTKFMASKSFYRMDTESMFESTVRKCVMAEIDKLTTAKGIRGLSDSERIPFRSSNWL